MHLSPTSKLGYLSFNTYEELSERALNLTKRARNLTDVFPYVGVHWQTYEGVTAA